MKTNGLGNVEWVQEKREIVVGEYKKLFREALL